MMTAKKNNDFCSQLWNSWIRVDSAYLQDKKVQKNKKEDSKK